MSKKMLIDATHPEETRVATIDQSNIITDYDFSSSLKETIKGNIYLAKIARVEPSLQAAFIEYGGGRHGFLAFSEIHPDYFRIPVSDREKLQQEILNLSENTDTLEDEEELDGVASDEEELFSEKATPLEEIGKRRFASLHRRYKIQEVVHKGQIILVQVAKEERGGKGAALTTFLSLPGRYCVLMPNSPRSGGVSRKISSQSDRSRLKKSLGALNLPQGMGLIVRTAGKDRTRSEIKRDAEYLMRLWNEIRQTTLASVAPSLIYQEDDIIKRAIRDMYSKEVEEIWVEGEEGYKIAKTFMRTLMPSHGKKIKQYKEANLSLFYTYGIESQIESMHHPRVDLPSGGSIVIHPTEALVSIDVNSGKSTRERHIEETALKTNLEAATEVARQLRLRDLAGLVVIDFIDMDEPRNVAAVERRVKESFKNDRARVQMGRISSFGLLELSRQRLSPSILEVSSQPCMHCSGTGYIRSRESLTVHILRLLEQECLKQPVQQITVKVAPMVAFYLLNHKRDILSALEKRQSVQIYIEPDKDVGQDRFMIQPVLQVNQEKPKVVLPVIHRLSEDKEVSSQEETKPEIASKQVLSEEGTEKKGRRNRRRSKKRGRSVTTGESVEEANAFPPEGDSPILGATAPSENEALPSKAGSEDKPLSASARRRRRKKNASREAKMASSASAGDSPLSEEQAIPLSDSGSVPPQRALPSSVAVDQGSSYSGPTPSSSTTPLKTHRVETPLQEKALKARAVKKGPKAPSKAAPAQAMEGGGKEEKDPLSPQPQQKFTLSPMDMLTLAPSLHPATEIDVQPPNKAKKSDKTWWRRILNSPSSGSK